MGRSMAGCFSNRGTCLKQTRRLHTGVYLESLVLDNCFQWTEVSNYPQASASVPTMGRLSGKGDGVGEGWVGPAGPVSSGTDELRARNSPLPSASQPPPLKGATNEIVFVCPMIQAS